jgi:hypothetical protein
MIARGSIGAWWDDPRVDPTVLLIGGFLTSPPLYGRTRERLFRRGAAHVIVANIWTPDWLLIPWRGHGPISTRAARSLIAAGEVARSSPRSKGAPLLVIGHSAGGVTARILTSPVPFAGRRFGGSERIGAIVTLGSPHRLAAGRANAAVAAQFAAEHVPGAFFAPRTGYLTVASRAEPGRRLGSPRERWLWRAYARAIGPGASDEIEGDGLVPVGSAILDDAGQIVLADIHHGQSARLPWYGSDEGLDGWWGAALETWRTALDVRRSAPGEPGDRARDRPGARE